VPKVRSQQQVRTLSKYSHYYSKTLLKNTTQKHYSKTLLKNTTQKHYSKTLLKNLAQKAVILSGAKDLRSQQATELSVAPPN
jgi:hypothetical protein